MEEEATVREAEDVCSDAAARMRIRENVVPIDTATPIAEDVHVSRQEALIAGTVPIERKQLTSEGGTSIAATPDPDRFYEPSYIPFLETLIAEVVKEEGPLPLPLLGRRISALHGWQRTGRRISRQISKSLGQVRSPGK